MVEARGAEFSAGQSFHEVIVVSAELLDRFAEFSGDTNPIHCHADVARTYGFPRRVAHGAIIVAALSRLIGMQVPGTGAVWLAQTVEWNSPVFEGDTVRLVATIATYSAGARTMTLDVHATNQREEIVMTGTGTVRMAEKVGGGDEAMEGPQVALITGGGRGIGAEIARHLARAGLTVIINFRSDEAAAQSVVDEVRAASGTARAMRADVSKPDEVAEMIAAVEREYGRVDVVVHAATPPLSSQPADELGYADVEPYLRTYVGGAIALVGAAVPGMKRRRFGRLIFLGTAALHGAPPSGWSPYLAGKHALWGLVRSLSVELGPSNITTNMVSPELTITDLTNGVPLRAKEVQARRIPMRRLPTAADTAQAVVYLASASAGYVNGQELLVSGGPA